jgi:hypothetical protein
MDFYQISNRDFLVQMTIGHVSYAGVINASLKDLRTLEKYETMSPLLSLTKPEYAVVKRLSERARFSKKNFEMVFTVKDGERRLTLRADKGASEIDLILKQPFKESITVATLFTRIKGFSITIRKSTACRRRAR